MTWFAILIILYGYIASLNHLSLLKPCFWNFTLDHLKKLIEKLWTTQKKIKSCTLQYFSWKCTNKSSDKTEHELFKDGCNQSIKIQLPISLKDKQIKILCVYSFDYKWKFNIINYKIPELSFVYFSRKTISSHQ